MTTFADAAPTAQNHGYNTDADNRLVLMDGGSPAAVAYDGRLAGVGATNNGFTDNGSACNTFNPTPGSGNDACPIGYYISWTSESDSTDPKIRVFVKMIYNGSTTVNPFQNFFNASSTSTGFNERYDVEVHRTARNVSKSFIVISHISTTGGGCSTGGFGACENSAIDPSYYGALMERPDEDKFNLVSYNSPGGAFQANSEIVFSEGGSFGCSLVTYGFRAGTIATTVQTDQSGAWAAVPGGEATGFAGVPTAGFATLVTNFNLNNLSAGKKIRFRQVCSRGRDAAVIAAGDLECQLGFKSSYAASSNARAVLSCSSLSD